MFLRARDFNVENSTILLRKAIEWRQKAKPQNITLASVRETMDRGTIFMYGVDKSNRFVTTDKKKYIQFYSNPEAVVYYLLIKALLPG